MRAAYLAALTVLVLTLVPRSIAAQSLVLKRELPAIAWGGCSDPAPQPDAGSIPQTRRDQAARLAADAGEAAILGDNAAAADRLRQAATLDPASATLSYRLARALEELKRSDEALTEYCRYLDLAPDGPDAQEVRNRIDALTEATGLVVTREAAQLFESALASHDAGRLAEAEVRFGAASDAAPGWGAVLFNRAAVRLALNRRQDAAADLRRYLALSPGAADFDTVLSLLGSLADVAAPAFDPATALVAGVIVPGLGHFTTDRPAMGAMFLGAAAGAAAVGLLVERLHVECLATPVDGTCPPDQVVREDMERPYLLPGLATAAAIGLFGAMDAYLGARRMNERQAALRIGLRGTTPALTAELMQVDAAGASLRLNLLSVRF